MSIFTKIYLFPEGYPSKWVAIDDEANGQSWNYSCTYTLENIKDYQLKHNTQRYLDRDWGRFESECRQGKHEDFCVWRADGKPLEPPEPFDFTQDKSLDRFDLILKD